jgi:dihydroflavonol-4-reductase
MFAYVAAPDGRLPDPDFWEGKRVCVTGGTGFLGGHLVEQLVGLGARVRVLALPADDADCLRGQPVECVLGDVRDPALVRRAAAGCDMIFHTAAVVAFWGPALGAMHAVGREGTRNVLAAAGRGVRVVHTSSIVAVGAATAGVPACEDSAFPAAALTIDYGRAKREAELLALEASGRQDVVVTNPTFLVGPRDPGPSDMGRYCLRFWKGRLPFAPAGGLNVVDVRDAARGHLLAAEHGRPGRRYILGGEDRTFLGLARALAEVAGLRPRWLPRLPAWLLGTAATAAAAVARLRGTRPYPSPQHARLCGHYWFARSDRAARELGYRPRPLTACLADTYRWFASCHDLRPRGLNAWWVRPGGPVVFAGRARVEADAPLPPRTARTGGPRPAGSGKARRSLP